MNIYIMPKTLEKNQSTNKQKYRKVSIQLTKNCTSIIQLSLLHIFVSSPQKRNVNFAEQQMSSLKHRGTRRMFKLTTEEL
jgi:hypothetical protein